MKKILSKFLTIVIYITLFSLSDLIAQCGFVAEPGEPVFENYTSTNVTLNLVFHVIRQSNGSGGASSSDLTYYVTELNTVYNPAGIYFDTLCTNFIDSTPIYNDCTLGFNGSNWVSMQTAYSTANAINVFIHPALGNSGNGCAFGNGNQVGFSCFIQNRAHRNLISHEIGHVLDLYHTFETSTGKSCLDDSTSLINGGDKCLDTPPDEDLFDFYGIINLSTCLWDTFACMSSVNCTDGCGNSPHSGFNPGIMMSYYHECTAFFTNDQQNRMKNKILNNLSGSYFNLPVADLVVDDSLTISSPYRAAANIIIENGGVLIVTSTLYMPEKSKIVIEPGGILSISGGTITKGNFKDICHERSGDSQFWYGIEMQRSTFGSYPKLYCTSGTIEYSEFGITNPSNSSGNAQIHVYSGAFKNNKNSISLIGGPTRNNLPIYISKARFYIDGSFPLGSYYSQVKIDNSKIYFDSCRFDNPSTKHPLDSTSYCIKAMNTDVGIQHTTFKDSLYGVQSMSMMSKNTLGVSNSKFSKMFVGINTTAGVNNYSIKLDSFDTSWKFGLLSDQCMGYIITNNYFGNSGYYANSVGIQMQASGVVPNSIQNNTFSNLKYGDISKGTNGDPNVGLQYLCNTHINSTTKDFLIEGMISGKQGSLQRAAGNTSDGYVSFDLNSSSVSKITYHYRDTTTERPTASPGTKLIGVKVSTRNCNLINKPNPDTLVHYTAFKQKEDTMDVRNGTHVSSIDGGNTSTLLSYISGATSGTATSLYNNLIYSSPWLSSAVVLAAYNRTDIYDSTHRAQLLYSNPDLFNSNDFRSSLRDASSPLVSNSLDNLDTLTNYSTARTDLESEIAFLNLEKNALCYDKLHELKIDSLINQDSILAWQTRTGDYGSLREVISTYYSNGDFTEAATALTNLGSITNLNSDQESDVDGLGDLLPYMVDIRGDDRYEGSLTEEEINWMIDFAESNPNQAGAEVRAALAFYYGINPDVDESLRKAKTHNTSVIGENVQSKVLANSEVNIYPNPSKNELTIVLPVTGKEDFWNVELLDWNGKFLQGIGTDTRQLRMDITNITNGIYLVKISNNKTDRIFKRVQIIK